MELKVNPGSWIVKRQSCGKCTNPKSGFPSATWVKPWCVSMGLTFPIITFIALFKSWGFNFPSHQKDSALTTPDLSPCYSVAPGWCIHIIGEVSLPSRGLRDPRELCCHDLWLPVLCLLRKITLSRWKVRGGGGAGLPVWLHALSCILQRRLHLQVIRTTCERYGEKSPNIEKQCVICLSFIQLCFQDFNVRQGGGAILHVETRNKGSLTADVLRRYFSAS